VGDIFGGIVKSGQFYFAVTSFQGALDKVVGEPGIFGEERSVKVSAIDLFIPGSLEAVFAIVAPADDDLPKRLHIVT